MYFFLPPQVPFDPHRLVFPPIPATVLAWLFYIPVSYIFSFPRIVIAGGLSGIKLELK